MSLSSLLHVHLCTPPHRLLRALLIIIAPRLYQLLRGNIHRCSTRNIHYDGNGWNGFFLWPNGWKSSRQHRNALIWKMLSPSLGAVWPLSVHPSHYVDGEEHADLTELSQVEICPISLLVLNLYFATVSIIFILIIIVSGPDLFFADWCSF